ncbi:uncharacterized protein LOC116653781 isoform X2 [Coturnix japonica]|uniref:uncharacterized protein LOC116653781 isoform X2 n=1 Tax=Coturnix japonica TaxID=93934 RepID=UPI0013A5E0A6|nr:uncharacterized protein LOC116653781 isoform X2 [Coturnix japonica]
MLSCFFVCLFWFFFWLASLYIVFQYSRTGCGALGVPQRARAVLAAVRLSAVWGAALTSTQRTQELQPAAPTALTARAPELGTSLAPLPERSTRWRGEKLRGLPCCLQPVALRWRCCCLSSSPPSCSDGLCRARAAGCRRSPIGERVHRPSRRGLVSAASVEPVRAEAEVCGGEAEDGGGPTGNGRDSGEVAVLSHGLKQ